MYQDELRGRNGVKEYPVNNQSEIIGPMKLTKPIKGENLHLTISKDIQLVAQQAITDQIQKVRTSTNKQEQANPLRATQWQWKLIRESRGDGKHARLRSERLAGRHQRERLELVTILFSQRYDQRSLSALPGRQGKRNHPSSLVYLGSTQKPLSILVGLNEKLFTTHTTYNDIGYFEFGREGHKVKIRNANNTANGSLTPWKAIAKSSNAFMSAMVGNKLYMQ